MSVSGNVPKKFRVGREEKYFILFFSFYFENGVKCKNVVIICQIVTLKQSSRNTF